MVEVALAAGAPAARLVENAEAVDPTWLDGLTTIGLSSGASVPEVLVHEVIAVLAERGYGTVEEITHTEERLAFALPQELRRELKSATSS
jgi:4-hydroxy-3-methylbut-2-enyl diphosphate reductase